MLDNESLEALEERLVDEAQRMLADTRQSPTIARLWAEFVRRRRQRTLAQVVCVTAAMIAVGLILTSWRLHLESMSPDLDRRRWRQSLPLLGSVSGSAKSQAPRRHPGSDRRD